MSKNPESGARGAIAGGVALAIVVGLAVGAMALFSDEVGENCEGSAFGCAWGAMCVDEDDGKRCRETCEADDDCPDGQECRSLVVIGGDGDRNACY